jgi:hypothetical protein
MHESCNPDCPQVRGSHGEGQGRGCACSDRATRAVYLAIWRWISETPEQPALLAVLAAITLMAVSACPHFILPF